MINQSFLSKTKAVHQYNTALAITNTIKGTSRAKLYKKLGIESLSFCWWFRRLCIFYIWESNKLNLQLHNAKSFKKFRNTLLKLGRPTSELIYKIHHPLGLKLLTRLRLGLSHLNEHRFKHNFKNCINLLWINLLLTYCHYYSTLCISFLNAQLPEGMFVKTLLCGNLIFDENDNQKIFDSKYILNSKRFSRCLL